jgi:hypothetical protein
MNSQQLDLDVRIDQQHAQAERAEADARRIDDRLAAIPGSDVWFRRKRSYGQAYNPWMGSGNLTAQGAIIKSDPALASYLAAQAGKPLPGRDYQAEAEQERWASSARSLERQTEEMRQRNLAQRQQQERARTYGTWNPVLGKVV